MTIKTEHAGAKNRGGYWGKREEAKRRSRKARRAGDRDAVTVKTVTRARETDPEEKEKP